MKSGKFLFICIFLLTSLFSQSIFAQFRGFKKVDVKINGKIEPLYNESYALIIGVSDYTEWPVLPGVKEDISEVKSALEKQGFKVITFINPPDKISIDNEFIDFINKYGQDKNNRLLFYFAGHGYTIAQNFGEDMGYIVPAQAPDPTKKLTEFKIKAMPMQQIQIYADQINSKHALFLFDACFAGSVFTGSRALPEAISKNTTKPVRQFITSGSKYERVSDKSDFRRQFISAINGDADKDEDGYVTGTELGDFIYRTVVKYSNETQHPQYGTINDPKFDKGDFVFVVPPQEQGKKNLEKNKNDVINIDNQPAINRNEIKSNNELNNLSEDNNGIMTGCIQLISEVDGSLYIDGVFKQKILANSVDTISDIPVGNHYFEIKGADNWSKSDIILRNQMLDLRIPKKTSNASKELNSMIYVEGGSYKMGSNSGKDNEKPPHIVNIKGFYIGKYEVTVGEFKKFVDATKYKTEAEKYNGSFIWNGTAWEKRSDISWQFDILGNKLTANDYNYPVVHVSWKDASEYCRWANGRLPTEAEWEYAAREGNKQTNYPFSGNTNPDEVAWYHENSNGNLHDAGMKKPNALGIYDMSGNVWEWCSDWYDKAYYSNSKMMNPTGPLTGSEHVIRGGSWIDNPDVIKITARSGANLRSENLSIGFRIVKDKKD